ncbi:ASCH domain-containing protein [Pseudomonas proteolytica]|nr:ASCH domain-containing protein [Pseudomonas proteolytica]
MRPSGSRIASGEKTLEIRRWYPGLEPSQDLLIVENERFLHADGDEDDAGVAVAVVRVKAVRAFTPEDVPAACASYFEEGWLAWELSDVRPLAHPFSALAARGIYEVEFMDNSENCMPPSHQSRHPSGHQRHLRHSHQRHGKPPVPRSTDRNGHHP